MIVKDRSKFMYMGPCNKYDKTTKFEKKLNRILKELRDKSERGEEVYSQIRSAGASRPRFHGLPKTNKKEFSMIGSAQHKLVKYLSW